MLGRAISLLVVLCLTPAALAAPDQGVTVFEKAGAVTFDVLKNAKWDADNYRWKRDGYGAGIGLRSDGWILCTSHQVDGAKSLTVVCPDGAARKADEWLWLNELDVGVIHVPDYEVPVPRFGSPDALEIGSTVFAVGRPFAFTRTITRGVVSGLHRPLYVNGKMKFPLQDYIQTDAQVNEGNSGGPLMNAKGEVVGLVCASLSAIDQSRPGVCFALPMDVVTTMARRLIAERKTFRSGGLEMQAADCHGLPLDLRKRLGCDEPHGVLLHSLGADAKATELRAEDVVLEIAGVRIWTWMQLRVRLAMYAPGTKLTLAIRRKGKRQDLEVTIGAWKKPD